MPDPTEPRPEPLRCDRCGHTMAEHDALAHCPATEPRPCAADRAAQLVRSAWMNWNGHGSLDDSYVAALMADPDLLVDLAIEAGVLEPWGAWLTAARCNHDAREWCDIKDHTETPLYRRPSRPTGEDRA